MPPPRVGGSPRHEAGTARVRPRMLRLSGVILVALGLLACAHATPQGADARASRYLIEHPETLPDIAKGIREFRIVLGMDQDQVIAAAGEPDIRSRFGGVRHPEVWLYRVARIGQDLPRSHGASFFRIVFADGRVSFHIGYHYE